MYDNGEGVPEDDAEAVRWYRLAAEQGTAAAQFNLGIMYDNGEGVPEDDAEAVRWYRLAAEQGTAAAQFNLGRMYANGEGVPEDDAEAMRWFRLAAEQGNATAQFLLGLMYASGEGVPEDDVTAYQGVLDALRHPFPIVPRTPALRPAVLGLVVPSLPVNSLGQLDNLGAALLGCHRFELVRLADLVFVQRVPALHLG